MFDPLPDTARVWIFTAGRELAPSEADLVQTQMHSFLRDWTSHGRPVPGQAALRHGRFLVVAARIDDEPNAGISGCGIDALTHAVDETGRQVGVEWVDGLHVAFRSPDGEVQVLPRPAFRQLVRDGAVTEATPVFDTTITSLGVLRAEGLERPAAESWHGRIFRLAEAA